jgi:hypothetical protein
MSGKTKIKRVQENPPGNRESDGKAMAVEHKTTIEPSSKALHQETVFQSGCHAIWFHVQVKYFFLRTGKHL